MGCLSAKDVKVPNSRKEFTNIRATRLPKRTFETSSETEEEEEEEE